MAWRPNWNDDERRDQQNYQRPVWSDKLRLANLPVVKWLLIVNIAVAVLVALRLLGPQGTGQLYQQGALTAEALLHGQLWRLLTYQFLHDPNSIWHIILNMFGLWMFGRIVEAQLGSRRFLTLFLLSGVAGGLAEVGFNLLLAAHGQGWETYRYVPTVGASAGVMGTTIAFAFINPEALLYLFLILPVKAKWAAVGWFVLTSYSMWESLQLSGKIGDGPQVAHAAHLGGMIFALLWMFWLRHQAALRRREPAGGGFDRLRESIQRSPGFGRGHPVVRGPNSGEAEVSPDEERRLDDLLRKVHEKGLASLSQAERDFLQTISQRKRRP